VDIEGCGELDIARMVTAQIDMHESWHEIRRRSLAIELDALYER
jgi:hypothetical protein